MPAVAAHFLATPTTETHQNCFWLSVMMHLQYIFFPNVMVTGLHWLSLYEVALVSQQDSVQSSSSSNYCSGQPHLLFAAYQRNTSFCSPGSINIWCWASSSLQVNDLEEAWTHVLTIADRFAPQPPHGKADWEGKLFVFLLLSFSTSVSFSISKWSPPLLLL